MSRGKAWFVAAAIGALLGAVIWLMWDYALRSFWVLALIFAGYGFVCFVIHLEKWLEKEPVEALHHTAGSAAGGFHSPAADGHMSMDEADAAVWEEV